MKLTLGLTLLECGRDLTVPAVLPLVETVISFDWTFFIGDGYGADRVEANTALTTFVPTTTVGGLEISRLIISAVDNITLDIIGIHDLDAFVSLEAGGMLFNTADANLSLVDGGVNTRWVWVVLDAVSGTQDIFGVIGEDGLSDTMTMGE
jgi:hypothetical protein